MILRLASMQHGVVSRRQLVQAGVSPDKVDRRLRAGRLHPLHRGVYRVGPVIARYAHEMAAVLACDEMAVISHRSAAALWQFLPARGVGPVEVILSRSDHGRRPNIQPHRVRGLHPDEVTKLDHIPITTPARTLLDIAGAVGPRELERALAEVLATRPANRSSIATLLSRYPRRRGTRMLRALLGPAHPALTRSEAEERFLSLIRKAHLPAPEANVAVGEYRVDFFWRAERRRSRWIRLSFLGRDVRGRPPARCRARRERSARHPGNLAADIERTRGDARSARAGAGQDERAVIRQPPRGAPPAGRASDWQFEERRLM